MTRSTSATKFSSIQSLAAAWAAMDAASSVMGRQARERRRRFIDDALNSEMPNTRHEEWKYTSLRPLVDRGFDLTGGTPASGGASREVLETLAGRIIAGALPIVFLDGQLIPDLPGAALPGLSLLKPLSDAEQNEDASWWDRWLPALDSGRLFWKMCLGLSSDGFVIRIPENYSDSRLFHVLHITTKENAGRALNTRILIDVAERSSIRVVEEFVGLPGSVNALGTWSNVLTQIRIGESATCGYYRVVNTPGDFHTGGVSVRLDRASRLDAMSLVMGGKLVRVDMDVQHTSVESECNLNGLTLARNSDHVDHHTSVDHSVGQTKTNQLFKGILADSARLVFNGKIFIRKQSQKSEAYQTCKNLLLSEEAEANAKPQLEIEADDVKASHGAAIGSVNPQELFYLQSRCIDKLKAVAILCRGFADDVMFRLQDDQVRNGLISRVSEWFDRQAEDGKDSELI